MMPTVLQVLGSGSVPVGVFRFRSYGRQIYGHVEPLPNLLSSNPGPLLAVLMMEVLRPDSFINLSYIKTPSTNLHSFSDHGLLMH